MKPRLDSAEFTEEDKQIWWRMGNRFGDGFYHLEFAATYARSDRTDAALMWSMEGALSRSQYPAHTRHMTFAFWYGGCPLTNLQFF